MPTESTCSPLLQGSDKLGDANNPCKYKYIFPARIALSSEADPPFKQGAVMGIAEADFPAIPL